MSIMLLVYSLCSIAYFSIGLLAIQKDRKSRTNRRFFLLNLNLTFWAICLALMSSATDPNVAALFRRLSVISWSTFIVLMLNFIFSLTHNERYTAGVWRKIVFYTPAIVCFFIYFFQPPSAEYIVRASFGWTFLNPSGMGLLWDQYLNLYYATYIIIGVIFLLKRYRKSKIVREKRQFFWIALSFFGIGMIALCTDIVLPLVGITFLPPLAVVLFVLTIVTIWYSVNKYGVMSISADRVTAGMSQTVGEGVLVFDQNENLISMNISAKKKLGYSQTEVESSNAIKEVLPAKFDISKKRYENYESIFTSTSGEQIPVRINSNILHDTYGDKLGVVLSFQDITEIKRIRSELANEKQSLAQKVAMRTIDLQCTNKKLEKEIELRINRESLSKNNAYYDHMTGLPNRRLLNIYLRSDIAKSNRSKVPIALLFLDLDGFKMVNDSFGHGVGDKLLVQLGNRLSKALRESDMVFRFGGDEFAILLYNPIDMHAISEICEGLIQAVNQPVYINQNEIRVSASIGVSVYPSDGEDGETLLKNADIAMYEAKKAGKGTHVFYNQKMMSGLNEMISLSNDLYRAVENGEFEVYYQPQISAKTELITGFEALVRWNHPEHGILLPDKFIYLAERTGLIVPIGKWVLEQACKQITEWNKEFHTKLKIAVNMSVKQIGNDNIVKDIINILEKTQVDPELVELEITESMLMSNVDRCVKVLSEIKKSQIKIAIDDFGTEYSSLNHLRNLSVNRIKIPKTFVDGINNNEADESIIMSTIALAKELNINILAEGVEQKHQLSYLQTQSCDDIQGFYFFEPMPASGIKAEIKKIAEKQTFES
jgi:diguanylate cyclase (GGDEF)-like protein/PAS domain S-box-containing protein